MTGHSGGQGERRDNEKKKERQILKLAPFISIPHLAGAKTVTQ